MNIIDHIDKLHAAATRDDLIPDTQFMLPVECVDFAADISDAWPAISRCLKSMKYHNDSWPDDDMTAALADLERLKP